MSTALFSSLLGLEVGVVLACAVISLWRRSLSSVVRLLATQGAALALCALTEGIRHGDITLDVTAVIVLGTKALLVPWLLRRVLAVGANQREPRPIINVPTSLVISTLLTLLAYVGSRGVVAIAPSIPGRMVPAGFAVVLIGFFAILSRRNFVSHIAGLLMIDNGIGLVAFLLTAGVPFLVELGVSLDVLLIVVVLRVLARRIGAQWGEVGIDELRELRD